MCVHVQVHVSAHILWCMCGGKRACVGASGQPRVLVAAFYFEASFLLTTVYQMDCAGGLWGVSFPASRA